MPGTTDTFAIPYPCVGDQITPSQFSAHALGVEAALNTVWTDANNALQPPAVAVSNNTGQVVATGVTSTLTYTTTNYNRGSLWSAAAPTLLTIPSAGSYLLASTSSGNITGNVTSIRWAFLRNGVELAYWENQNTGAFIPTSSLSLNVLAVGCNPGDQITMTVLYTGTQPTLNFFGRVNVTRLAIP